MALPITFEKAKEFTKGLIRGKSMDEMVAQDEGYRRSMEEIFASQVIADIKGKFTERQNQRRGLELQWRLNINFMNGDQFTEIEPYLGDIVTTPLFTEFEERNVFNEIAPNIETKLAILTKRKNVMKCTPASSSSEDRVSAKIANKVIASMRRRLNISEMFQMGNFLSQITGSAVFKSVWDSSAGRTVGIMRSELSEEERSKVDPAIIYEQQLLGIDPNAVYNKIYEGDVSVSVHSPFEIYPENLALPANKNRRIMHVLLLSPDEVLDKWGVIESGTENETYKITDTSDRSYGGAVSGRLFGKMLSVEKIHNTVKVYEEWELPSRKYPSGRLIICTDNNLLYYGSIPDRLGEHGEYLLPFDVQYSLRTDGFFGKSIIERLIPVQRAINSNKNRIQDYLNRIAIGVLVAEEGSVPNLDEFLQSGIMPGDVIEYMVGRHAPRFMDVPSLPADIFRETNDLIEQIDRLSGVSQLAKQSTVSPSISAASAIAGLAEQDDTRIGLEGENSKAAYISFTKKSLILYHHNVKYPRMVADIGKNDEFEISQFRGNELTSFDVEILPEPEAADTMATRRQKIIDLWNSGILKDPETGTLTSAGRAKLLEAMQFGDLDIFTDGDNVHVERAHRENQAMVAGDVCEVVEYDDDTIHIGSHNDFRLSAEYEDAVKKDPTLNGRFEEHVNVHLANFERKNSVQEAQAEQAVEMPPDEEIPS